MKVKKSKMKIVYGERELLSACCEIRKDPFEGRFGKGSFQDLFMKEWYHEFENELKKIPQICIQNHDWKEEGIFRIFFVTTYTNPYM
jgi:hypothetical protein